MLEQQSDAIRPTIDVSLKMDTSLHRVLEASGPLYKAVLDNVQQKLGDLVRLLGVPGAVVLDIGLLEAPEQDRSCWMTLRVNGTICRYPDEVLVFAWCYVNGRIANVQPAKVRSEIQAAASAEAEHCGNLVAEFFGLVCADIVSRQPTVLLGFVQAAAYSAQLERHTSNQQLHRDPLDTSWLLLILKRVLDLRISIADTEEVTRVLAESSGQSWEDVSENLVNALAPDVVELHVPEAYVAQLTTPDKEGTDLLTFAAEGMFVELGIVFPPVRLVPTQKLKPNSFRLLINHLPMLPIIGLEANACLVNDTPAQLQLMRIEAQAATNPVTQQPGAVVDSTKKEVLKAAGLTLWDQADYCILCLAEALRRNAACFMRERMIHVQVEQFKQAFPVLVDVACTRVSMKSLTRVLRALVAEGVSIRNLRLILERLLDYQFRMSDNERYLLLDDRLSTSGYLQNHYTDSLVPFVRAGLKRQISNKFARGTPTLVVYIVDPELEDLFIQSELDRASAEDRQEKIITAVTKELTDLPSVAQTPAILTAIAVRANLQDALRLRFPRMGVLAYQELLADLNIQPVARISLRDV